MIENRFRINSIHKLILTSSEVKVLLKFTTMLKQKVRATSQIYKLSTIKLTPDSETNVKRLRKYESLKESNSIGKRKSKISSLNIIPT